MEDLSKYDRAFAAAQRRMNEAERAAQSAIENGRLAHNHVELLLEYKESVDAAIEAKNERDAAYAQRERELEPPEYIPSSPQEEAAWIEVLEAEATDALRRSAELQRAIDALPELPELDTDAHVSIEAHTAALDQLKAHSDRLIPLLDAGDQANKDFDAAAQALRRIRRKHE